MNLISLVVILSMTLASTLTFEGFLLIFLRRRYQFQITRFGIDLFVSLFLALILMYGVAFVNPISSVAFQQTASFVSHQYPSQNRHIKKLQYVPTSATSGYFLYDCTVADNAFILKTSYSKSSNITSFVTEPGSNR